MSFALSVASGTYTDTTSGITLSATPVTVSDAAAVGILSRARFNAQPVIATLNDPASNSGSTGTVVTESGVPAVTASSLPSSTLDVRAVLRATGFRPSTTLYDPVNIANLTGSHEAADWNTYALLANAAPVSSPSASRPVAGGLAGTALTSSGYSYYADGFPGTSAAPKPYLRATGSGSLSLPVGTPATTAWTFVLLMHLEHAQGESPFIQFDANHFVSIKEANAAYYFDNGSYTNASGGPLATNSGDGQIMSFVLTGSAAGVTVAVNGTSCFGTRAAVNLTALTLPAGDARQSRKIVGIEAFSRTLAASETAVVEKWLAADAGTATSWLS